MPATSPNGFDLFVSFFTSDKFIAAIIGMISGTIATFLAPWTKWHFKVKELKRESRIERIQFWRNELNQATNEADFHHTTTFLALTGLNRKSKKKIKALFRMMRLK